MQKVKTMPTDKTKPSSRRRSPRRGAEESDLSAQLTQPPLLDFSDSSSGSVELFPRIWSAAEAWVSGDTDARWRALDSIEATKAARLSPVIAHLLAPGITEPDLGLRTRVIHILGEVLSADENGRPAPEPVRQTLRRLLGQMRTRQVYAILQAVVNDPESTQAASRLFNACPHAGNHLSDILVDRTAPMELRFAAVRMIARVGYLDTIPALERIQTRLEGRKNGQTTLPFAPTSADAEASLLEEVEQALHILRTP